MYASAVCLQKTAHPHASTPALDHWDWPQWISAVVFFKSTQPFTRRIQSITDIPSNTIFQGTARASCSLRDREPRSKHGYKGGRAGAVPARALSHSTQVRRVGQVWGWQLRIQTTTQVCGHKAGLRSSWEAASESGLVWATRVRQPSNPQPSPQWQGKSKDRLGSQSVCQDQWGPQSGKAWLWLSWRQALLHHTLGRESRPQAELNWSLGLWPEVGGRSQVKLVRAIKA